MEFAVMDLAVMDLAVMEISMFDDLKSRGVPLRELTRNVSRVVVARR